MSLFSIYYEFEVSGKNIRQIAEDLELIDFKNYLEASLSRHGIHFKCYNSQKEI